MTERIVRKVEATRQMHTMAPLRALTRRKAACYLRISTRSDEQENSLENQRAHYEELFATSPDYEFAGCYYDDGVSGTGMRCLRSVGRWPLSCLREPDPAV